MYLAIDNLIPPADVRRYREAIRNSEWQDGRLTAGRWGQERKKNRQLSDAYLASERKQMLDAMLYSAEVSREIFPARSVPPVINCYQEGDRYDWHQDSAIQAGIRADISYTLFLTDPQEYDGGELVIDEGGGMKEFKLAAGGAVFYSSGTPHMVREVTRGVRIAAIGWVQSLFRDDRDRSMLALIHDCLSKVREFPGGEVPFRQLSLVEAQLYRRWAQPM